MEDYILNKKVIVITAIVFLTLLLGGVVAALVVTQIKKSDEEKQKKAISSKSEEFIKNWGTYDYNTFPDYSEKIKSSASDALFAETFSNKLSLDIRKGKMVTKKYSTETVPLKTVSVKKISDTNYSVVVSVKVKVVSTVENYEKTKTVTLDWKKFGNDFKVVKVVYN